MNRITTAKNAREMYRRLTNEGKSVSMEWYADGTDWHTDFIGNYVEDDARIPDTAICAYQVMNREDYAHTILANDGTDISDVWDDDLDFMIVVNVKTDEYGDYVTENNEKEA